MEKFTLVFDQTQDNFSTKFKNLSPSFLRGLQEKAFLPHVLPELFPEKFSGEIVIDRNGSDMLDADIHIVCFYLELEATEEMKIKTKKYRNRSIDICSDDNKVEFAITIRRNSGYFKEDSDKQIILCI